MPATSDCIDQVHDATPLPLDFNNTSLVQIAVAKASQVNENGNERPFALLENSEVHEDNSALVNTPRKRRRLEVQIGESSDLQLRPASCNNNLQTIAWEFPLQSSGTTSNVLEIHNQSLMMKPATLHSLQYALPNNISHEISQSSPLDVSAGLRPEHGGRQHNELMPYTYNAFLPIALEMQNVQRYKNSPQLQIQLHDFRVVPDTARSVWFAITGNIGGLQKLFAQGLASPKDISYTRQYSLVRWALYGGMNNYPTVKFLLSQGASVDEESYRHVWDYAYRMKCNPTELSELKCITMQPPTSYIHTDWVEEQRFPQIHKIVLGRCSESLSVEIDANPNAVNLTDAMNRTALDWATALAKLSDMRILIDRGSPLNSIDVSGRSTVLHAVDSHNEDALSMILEAGADPNPEIPGGLFRSSPLTAATFGGLEGMVKRLLNHGAKVDACNPEGRTALHTVASMQNVECARILLDHGANLGLVNSKGFSPIMTAVVHNSHAVLKLFIDRCNADCLEGSQLLPVIAQFADTETMSILATSPLLRETLCKEDLTSGRRSLESRTDYDKVLGNAFDSLCR
ncbi:hypothetical protein COCC4DRAFT_148962 [Bipolaris maydis ATCC 48331]|uniref:Uncharacterized protein n=2 Tax=Cochliobolus heterostrophus TaxID=5016 RepID=M2TJH3_COCH5|nr:uncharacterized protein COCC4DRAFT_148962 [Bipolaris maydis ATCC 48331]EMD97585.1 hypothetical protein COCHEDRAFT_1025979 [Bipolaris maydis C5]ENI01083.1 hypothetical protein COCC4DRAFT_148962 [Bipolaris maydis ATCC 48331]